MKKFPVLMIATLSFNVFAGSCATSIGKISGLDTTTQQAMIVQCEQAKLQAVQNAPEKVEQVSSETVEQMDKWSEISLKFAKALGVAAQELGVAANQFLSTPAGVFTAVIIAWKMFNVTSWLAFTVIVGLVAKIASSFIRFVRHDGYEEVETRFGKRKVSKVARWKDLQDNQVALVVIAYVIFAAATFFTGVNVF